MVHLLCCTICDEKSGKKLWLVKKPQGKTMLKMRPRTPDEFAADVRRGGLIALPGALERFTPEELKAALHRHMTLDWADMDEEDQAANLRAAKEGETVRGAFRVRVTPEQDPDLWIITEADRTMTTFQLPEEFE
jgi:hypothetical protein